MSIIGTIRDAVTGLTASVEARKQTPTGNALNVQIGPGDIISNIPVVMEFGQHQVHEGESHGAEYYSTAVATISFGLTVPVYANTINAPHLLFHAQIYEGAGMLSLFEGSTFTGGTAVTSYNRNRNNATAPGMTIKSGAEPATFATLTDQQKLDIIDAHLLAVIQNLARTQHSLAAQEAARLAAATEAETKFI